jgi:Tol biopolymer transport system component
LLYYNSTNSIIGGGKNMRNKILIVGIAVLLVVVGFSGCVTEKEGVSQGEQFNGTEPETGLEGKIAYVSSGNIHLINTDGTNEIRLTDGFEPIWSPDGNKIAFSKTEFTEEGGVYSPTYIMNADGTEEVKIQNISEGYSWSPDGSKILFSSWAEGVFTITTDGKNKETIFECQGEIAVFSSDGSKVAYICAQEESDYLYIINSDGTNAKLIEDKISIEYSPYRGLAWSPDGMKIACVSGRTLFVMDVDGTNKIQLDYSASTGPVWSPNTKKIAYWNPYDDALCIINSDGTGKTLVASSDWYGNSPSWSPDGKRIVFNMGKTSSIYIVNADGSGLAQLVYGSYPQWSPS